MVWDEYLTLLCICCGSLSLVLGIYNFRVVAKWPAVRPALRSGLTGGVRSSELLRIAHQIHVWECLGVFALDVIRNENWT